MPNYEVKMGRGVTIPSLWGNTLSTGYSDAANVVQSCSVVFMMNHRTAAAGCFHYPAGVLSPEKMAAMRRMAVAVQPHSVILCAGALSQLGGAPGNRPSDPSFHSLMQWLGTRAFGIDISLRVKLCREGQAYIAIVDRAFQVLHTDLPADDYVALHAVADGVFMGRVQVYSVT